MGKKGIFGFAREKRVDTYEKDPHELKTRIYVYYDVGFPNTLYIRGKGAGLNWEKGEKLKNEGPNLWIWESGIPFDHCEFKVLVNDQRYEEGENHKISFGSKVQYTPRF